LRSAENILCGAPRATQNILLNLHLLFYCRVNKQMTLNTGQFFVYIYIDPLLESVPDLAVWAKTADRVYQDLGDREQLQQLLQYCTSRESPDGRIDGPITVWVPRLEDLGDSLAAVHDCLSQLEQADVQVQVGPTQIAISDPALRLELLKLLQTVQTQQQARQLRRGHARNRLKTLPPPGRAPYGYRRGKDRYILDRSTAPVVKDFFEHFLLYGSLRQSVRYLQKKYSKKISVSTGQRWLTSPIYRGDLSYHNSETIANTHAAILSRQEAAQIDRLLRRNRTLPPRAASAPRSLSGLVVCSVCDSAMKVSRAARRRQDYLYLCPVACPNQPKCRALIYQQVLEQTIERICADLLPALGQAALPNLEGIKQGVSAQVDAKQTVLEQLPGLVESGVLDAETAELRSYKLKTEMAKLQTSLAQLPPVNLKATAEAVSIPQFWLDLSEAERRFYFREFIQQIQILRSTEPGLNEPDAVEPEWRVKLVFMF
jgi:DNA invertase Pin-like site-specific DNA recombinase